MIRFACPQDMPDIIRLWDQCFPDEGGFNPYFFENLFAPACTLLLLEEGRLCAMTQMLPYRLRTPLGNEEVTYIYGACTALEMRKRGYMAQLLQHSFTLDRQAGRAASILIPQEEWLFGFYRKFGYQPAFFVTEECYTTPKETTHTSAALQTLSSSDVLALQHFYEVQSRNIACAILRDTDQWKQQLKMFSTLGAGAYALKDSEIRAYAFVWKTDEGLWAQEMFSDGSESEEALCAALCHRLNTPSLRVTKSGLSRALGCAKFYDNRPALQGYINLMFN